jgi:hypothetical protein
VNLINISTRRADRMLVTRERALADLGSQLVTKSGKKSTAEALGKAALIGLYFSAHWVSPAALALAAAP